MSLYDPGEFPNEVETTTDFSLADVLAWARTKPADEKYDYIDAEICAVAQFGRETDRPYLIDISLGNYPELEKAACDGPWTFGAFVARLEQAMAR